MGEDKDDGKEFEYNFQGHLGLQQNVIGRKLLDWIIVLKGNLFYMWQLKIEMGFRCLVSPPNGNFQ